MAETTPIKNAIPQSKQPQKVSLAALGLLATTTALAVILTFSTYKNINRAEMLMEKFLQDKAEMVIHSIKAGRRASMVMMHHMNGLNPMHPLLIENSKEKDILFIIIYNTDGSVIDQAGYPEPLVFSQADLNTMLRSNKPVTVYNKDMGVFIYSKTFLDGSHFRQMHMPKGSEGENSTELVENTKLISIGLITKEFDRARNQDVRHALFMGALLFMVGSAGLYVFYLYQRMRATGATLADMKLYTDSVINSIPVSLITLDAEDRVVSCNRNAEILFDCNQEELHHKNIHKIASSCSGAITTPCDTVHEYAVELERENKRSVPLRISCSPLVDHEGENIGKVLVIRDMSLIRDMEIQLERSRRMAALGKMAAGIAHEIRNPLGTLRGFAQYFGNQPELGEEGRKYSELMTSEIDRLNQTVSGLLQFSRPREPEMQPVLLDELFRKTATLLEADMHSHKIQFHWQSNTGRLVTLDPDLILQVLLNLLKNSINATEEGGKISLSITDSEQEIGIIIEDTGCGMSEIQREKMFDPFYTTTKTGTGLGLAVSHQIVEQHRGRFEVKTQIGHGTKITMFLPKQN